MGRPKKNPLPEVETQSQEELPIAADNVTTQRHNPASELVSAFLALMDAIDKNVDTRLPFSDYGPYQLMSLPEHLWPLLLTDSTRTILNARRDSLRALLDQLQETTSRG